MKVINLTGGTSISGRLVKVNTARTNSFDFLGKNEQAMIGICVQSGISNGIACEVATSGSAYLFVNGTCKKGDLIRSLKTGDAGSKGTAVVVRSSDSDYLKVGTALASGYNSLILVALNVEYKTTFNDADTIDWDNITNTPTTIDGYGITDHQIMGEAPDITEFDATGHQTMEGDARPWRDELGDALSIQRNGAGLTLNLAENTIDFDYNAAYNANPSLADMLYKNVQLNHDKDLSVSVYPHIHWMQAKNYIPNFLFQYRWQINGGEKVTAWTFLKCNLLAFPYTPGTTIHQISYSLPILAPVGSTLSDIIQFKIYRDTSNASLQFTGTCPYNTGGNASAPVLSFDLHFQINSLGSTDELTK